MVPRRAHLPYVLGTIAVLAVGNAIGMALAPALLTHSPLLLVALSPLGRHLILVATVTSIGPFVLVAALRRTFAGMLAWYLGHVYGDEGVAWVERRYPRIGGFARTLQRIFERLGAPLLLVAPGLLFSALAGVVRMPWWLAAVLVFVGQLMWMTLTFHLGDALREWIEPIMILLQQYMFEATAISVLLVAAYELHRRRSRRGDALSELAGAGRGEEPGE